MQRVFFESDPSKYCFAFKTDGEWSFSFGNAEAQTVDAAIAYLTTLRRYPSRNTFTVEDLFTFEMRHGETIVVPWLEFVATEEQWLQDLLEAQCIHDCFCCAESFAEIEPLASIETGARHNRLIQSPCGIDDHAICIECLRRVILNFYSHPVTKSHPYVTCLFDDCGGTARMPLPHFRRILTDEEFVQLQEHVQKMRIPDVLTVECAHCDQNVTVECHERLQNRFPISMGCDRCFSTTCFHCMSPEAFCMCLRISGDRPYGGFFNRYVRPPPGHGTLYRNYELDLRKCIPTLTMIFTGYDDGVDMVTPCQKCGALVQKSILCNEMAHCGFKWCYLCGRMTLPTETLLMDHFGRGIDECPRYESREYWVSSGAVHYQCQEDDCYSDTQECTREDHQSGRVEKHKTRRRIWLQELMCSLPMRLRWLVMGYLQDTYSPTHPLIVEWLGRPGYMNPSRFPLPLLEIVPSIVFNSPHSTASSEEVVLEP